MYTNLNFNLTQYENDPSWVKVFEKFNEQKEKNQPIFKSLLDNLKEKGKNNLHDKLIELNKKLSERKLMKSVSMYQAQIACRASKNDPNNNIYTDLKKFAKMNNTLNEEENNQNIKFQDKVFGNCALYAVQVEQILNTIGLQNHIMIFAQPDHSFNLLFHDGIFIAIDGFNNLIYEFNEENFSKYADLGGIYDLQIFSTNKSSNYSYKITKDLTLSSFPKEFYADNSFFKKFHKQIEKVEKSTHGEKNKEIIKDRMIEKLNELIQDQKDNGTDLLSPNKVFTIMNAACHFGLEGTIFKENQEIKKFVENTKKLQDMTSNLMEQWNNEDKKAAINELLSVTGLTSKSLNH